MSYHIRGYRFAPWAAGLPDWRGEAGGRKYTAERALLEETPMADKPSQGPADIIAASTAPGDIDARVARLEPRAAVRLIRPDSEYVGERGLTWTPLGRR
jgi:hypothetical protein